VSAVADRPEAARAPDGLHVPVLVDEVLRWLTPVPPGTWIVDGTVGLGGHAAALLSHAAESRLLGLDRDSERLRAVCCAVLMTWQNIIAAGLEEVPDAERLEVAELILGTLEGALILSRAEATKDALLRAGRILGDMLGRKYLASGEGVDSPQ